MIRKVYRLTRADYRATVNLQEVSDGGIEKAVKEVLGDSLVVNVTKDYYEYYVEEKPTRGQLIAIGRKISLYCPELRDYARIYIPKKEGRKPIRQIFKKVIEEEILWEKIQLRGL